MVKKYKKSLFIFHRDLRLSDNTGLIQALQKSEQVIPIFIFSKKQIDQNEYRGDFSLNFMIECLEDLASHLEQKKSQLNCFYGATTEVIEQLIKQENPQAIFSNRDYTPFAIQRDQEILERCQRHQVALKIYDDALLQPPEKVSKDDGQPYTIFTPFFRKASGLPVLPVQENNDSNYSQKPLKGAEISFLKKIKTKNKLSSAYKGGRVEALKSLGQLKLLKNYKETRDIPSIESGTSHLSAHHKFGTISIRETWHAVVQNHGPDHTLITELYWRDFFHHTAIHFPHVFKGAFRQKYNAIPWNQNQIWFQKWCEGKTGFPIVDAGMRQLNQTGDMHNRLRMITASFLVKDLHIHWQWGEKYFAQKLLDYDPCVNNGNWQWAASTGCDTQPYFRIFNPWRQQQRFDPEAKYIKKWLPELNQLTAKQIHQLEKSSEHCPVNYCKPMVTHANQANQIKLSFKLI